MTFQNPKLIVDLNLTAFPVASLRRALKNCDPDTRRRLAHPKAAEGHQSVSPSPPRTSGPTRAPK